MAERSAYQPQAGVGAAQTTRGQLPPAGTVPQPQQMDHQDHGQQGPGTLNREVPRDHFGHNLRFEEAPPHTPQAQQRNWDNYHQVGPRDFGYGGAGAPQQFGGGPPPPPAHQLWPVLEARVNGGGKCGSL